MPNSQLNSTQFIDRVSHNLIKITKYCFAGGLSRPRQSKASACSLSLSLYVSVCCLSLSCTQTHAQTRLDNSILNVVLLYSEVVYLPTIINGLCFKTNKSNKERRQQRKKQSERERAWARETALIRKGSTQREGERERACRQVAKKSDYNDKSVCAYFSRYYNFQELNKTHTLCKRNTWISKERDCFKIFIIILMFN